MPDLESHARPSSTKNQPSRTWNRENMLLCINLLATAWLTKRCHERAATRPSRGFLPQSPLFLPNAKGQAKRIA